MAAEKWYHFPALCDRDALKALLLKHEEYLSEVGREAGCSAQQVRLAMKKHFITLEKDRETASGKEMMLRWMLRGGNL